MRRSWLLAIPVVVGCSSFSTAPDSADAGSADAGSMDVTPEPVAQEAGVDASVEPCSVDTVLLGSRGGNGETKDTITTGATDAYGYVGVLGGTARCARLYIEAKADVGPVRIGVYADDPDGPGALVAAGAIDDTTQGWHAAVLDTALPIDAGTTRYWLGAVGSGTVPVLYRASAPCPAGAFGGRRTNYGGGALPMKFTSNASGPECGLEIYLSP